MQDEREIKTQCPRCGAEINEEYELCPHCRKRAERSTKKVEEQAAAASGSTPRIFWFKLGALLFLLVCFIVFLLCLPVLAETVKKYQSGIIPSDQPGYVPPPPVITVAHLTVYEIPARLSFYILSIAVLGFAVLTVLDFMRFRSIEEQSAFPAAAIFLQVLNLLNLFLFFGPRSAQYNTVTLSAPDIGLILAAVCIVLFGVLYFREYFIHRSAAKKAEAK